MKNGINCKILFFSSLLVLNILNSQENAPFTGPEYSPDENAWTTQYIDPIDLTKEIIKNTYGFWTPAGYFTTKAVYTVGAWFAMHGAGYILLESPNLVIDLVQGGFYKVVVSVSYDVILEIIETTVKTPQKICKKMSKSVIKDGLNNYETAYNIARDYIETGNLSKEDATKFLINRWGLYKLAIARTLYNESSEGNYQIDEQLAEKTADELMIFFADNYQSSLGIDNTLPIIESAFFIKDMSDILTDKQIGLINYTPYINFMNYMESLNQVMLDELERVSQSTSQSAKITLGFILDSSGSMGSNDPHDIRKEGTKIIVRDRLSGQENVFIVDFDDQAKWLNSNSWQNWIKNDLINAINKIDSRSSSTNIDKGLDVMSDALISSNTDLSNCAVILLTDGVGDYTDGANWYSSNNIPVYTVSFVGNVNEKLLTDIAYQTGGEYLRANSPIDIVSLFNLFYNNLSSGSTFLSESGNIMQGETVQYDFYIDNVNGDLGISTVWGGSEIDMILHSPSGQIYSETSGLGSWYAGKNYVTTSFSNPETGKWHAELYGVSIPSQGEKFSFEINGQSDLYFTISSVSTTDYTGSYTINCSQPDHLQNYNIKLTLISPKGKEIDISTEISNNTFSMIPIYGEGSYKYKINITGQFIDGSPFQRSLEKHIFIGDYKPVHIAAITDVLANNFVTAKIGSNVGNTPGIKCYIYRGDVHNSANLIAEGYILTSSIDNCQAQLQIFHTNTQIIKGDILMLDEKQWRRD